MKEARLKKITYYFFLAAKLITVLMILISWGPDGFSSDQMTGTLTLVLPLFTVYTSLMFKQTVQNRYVSEEKIVSKKLTSTFRTTTFFVLFIYVLLINVIIYAGGLGNLLSFQKMQTVIGLVEAGFGVYVGQIILALFKKEE